jgi:hypothetical protein
MENSNNLNKIGIAKNPLIRKRQLELASGCQIRIMKCWQTLDASALEVEQYLHKLFSRRRCEGEWFSKINIHDIEYCGYELKECNHNGLEKRLNG